MSCITYALWRLTSRNFADRETERIWSVLGSRKLEIQDKALIKLRLINNALRLDDLRVPPGKRLGALRGERRGQFSLRMNDQRRICFRWLDEAPGDVEITDYH